MFVPNEQNEVLKAEFWWQRHIRISVTHVSEQKKKYKSVQKYFWHHMRTKTLFYFSTLFMKIFIFAREIATLDRYFAYKFMWFNKMFFFLYKRYKLSFKRLLYIQISPHNRSQFHWKYKSIRSFVLHKMKIKKEARFQQNSKIFSVSCFVKNKNWIERNSTLWYGRQLKKVILSACLSILRYLDIFMSTGYEISRGFWLLA